MLGFLRFVGLFNAAIWLGSLLFASFIVLPVFFSPEVTPALVHRYYSGRIAEIVLHRLFWTQLVCVGIAILHYIAEWLYAGKPLSKGSVGSLAVILAIVALGGFWLEPKMARWHLVKYASNTTPAQKAEAAKSFGRWHGASRVLNLVVVVGALVHFVRQSSPAPSSKIPRPARPTKA